MALSAVPKPSLRVRRLHNVDESRAKRRVCTVRDRQVIMRVGHDNRVSADRRPEDFQAMRRMGSDANAAPGMQNIVCSRTLRPNDYPHLTISDDAERLVADFRTQSGEDSALFGGGELFRSLLAAQLVDRVGVSLIRCCLEGGFRFFRRPPGERP